jgi:hypothetical protein
MEVWLSRSLSHKLFFFTMEFWLSRSLSHELFFFTMEFWLPGSLSHELFFFTMEFWLSRSLSHELFFFTMEFSKYAIWGEDSLYIYIYITKSIYTGSASLKTLLLDLEPPLQGKEYGPYSNATKKRKANVFPEITYRHVIRIFYLSECKFAKIEKRLYITSSYNWNFQG